MHPGKSETGCLPFKSEIEAPRILAKIGLITCGFQSSTDRKRLAPRLRAAARFRSLFSVERQC